MLNGSPVQSTTSAFLPGSSEPILVVELQRPRRIYRHPLYRHVLGDVDACSATGVHRLCDFLIQTLRSGRIVGVNHRLHAGSVDEREIGANSVHRLFLEAAPVGPHRRAGAVLAQQVGDLVRFDSVVECADLEAEFLRDVEHLRHLVGAIAVHLRKNVAAQYFGQRLEREVARRRRPLVIRIPFVPLATVFRGLDVRGAVAGDVAHTRRRTAAAAYTRFGFSPHAILSPYLAPGNFIP